jgi:esterase/lipase superfamily enzyme
MTYGIRCQNPQGGAATCQEPGWLEETVPSWPADDQLLQLEKDQLFKAVAASRLNVVLFIHGFNYSFDESTELTLRLVERARVQATPVAYSWPSQDRVSAYGLDYDMSEWTIDHLAEFIHDLVEAVPEGRRLHIVAQSMGNRALLMALARLHLPQERLGQLVLIAPDVDTQVFKELIQHCGHFQRTTIYVSSHDLALRAAGLLHAGSPRAGDARRQYLVLSGADTVDVSGLKSGLSGHSIYEYSQWMFADLGEVLEGRTVADRKVPACTVRSIDSYNATHGTSLPCVAL